MVERVIEGGECGNLKKKRVKLKREQSVKLRKRVVQNKLGEGVEGRGQKVRKKWRHMKQTSACELCGAKQKT